MITLFKVSDIGFIANDSDKEILRFIPAGDLNKKYNQKEILERIFSEDIAVNEEPIPPEYTPIIQQLIDTEPQPETAADVAQILSLYNPADISEILKSLINTKPQPTTDEQIFQILKAYPYQANSAIYDYKYLNWSALGDGQIYRNGDSYTFIEAGIQKTNIFPSSSADIEIYLAVKLAIDISKNIFFLYTNINSESTNTPHFALQYNATSKNFIIARRSTNNGTITNGDSYTDTFNYDETTELYFYKHSDGSCELRNKNKFPLTFISSSSTFKPRHIRINFGKSGSDTTSHRIVIEKLQIKVDNVIYSQWYK